VRKELKRKWQDINVVTWIFFWPYGPSLIIKLQVWYKTDASTTRTKCSFLSPRVSANQVLAQNVRSGIYRICVYRFTRNVHKLILFLPLTFGNLMAVTMEITNFWVVTSDKELPTFQKNYEPQFLSRRWRQILPKNHSIATRLWTMRYHTPEDSDVIKAYTSSVWSSTIIKLHERRSRQPD